MTNTDVDALAEQNRKDERNKIVSRIVRFTALAVAVVAGAIARFGDGGVSLYIVSVVALLVTVPTFSYRRYLERKMRKQA